MRTSITCYGDDFPEVKQVQDGQWFEVCDIESELALVVKERCSSYL